MSAGVAQDISLPWGRVVAWLVARARRGFARRLLVVLALAGAGLASEVAGYALVYGFLKSSEAHEQLVVLGHPLGGEPALVAILAGGLLLAGAWLVYRATVSTLALRRSYTEERLLADVMLLAELPMPSARKANALLARGELADILLRGASDAGRSTALLAELLVPTLTLCASLAVLLWLSAPFTLGVLVLGALAGLLVLRSRAAAEVAAHRLRPARRLAIRDARAMLERGPSDGAPAALPAGIRDYLDAFFDRHLAGERASLVLGLPVPAAIALALGLAPVAATGQGDWLWSDLLACFVALRYGMRSATRLGVGMVTLSRYLPAVRDSITLVDEIEQARGARAGGSFQVRAPALHDAASASPVLRAGERLAVVGPRPSRRLAAAVQAAGTGDEGASACAVSFEEDAGSDRLRLVRHKVGDDVGGEVVLVVARGAVVGWCTPAWLATHRAEVRTLLDRRDDDDDAAPLDDDERVDEA